MPVGIDLRITPGPGGRPEVLLLEDVERECPLCGFVETQRVFASAPLHPLTIGALRQRAAAIGGAHTFACPQCDEPVGPGATHRAALHFGFPGDDGILSAYADVRGGSAVRWQILPQARLDVQMLPRWAPVDDLAGAVTEQPDEAWVTARAGRPLNGKEALRAALRTAGTPAGATVLAPDMAVVWGPAELDAAGARAGLAAVGNLTATWVVEPLVQGGCARDGGFGAPAAWLGDLLSGLPAPSVWVGVSPGRVMQALERILATLPIGARLRPTAAAAVEVVLPGPHTRQPLFDPEAVAREAARTALVPSDAARAELDRLILWQLMPELAEGTDVEGAHDGAG